MDDLTKEFITESQEGLERMEQCLTELERRPGDAELVAEIFRAVHTIKGTTGFLGFGRLEALAHAGENLLGALRDGDLRVTPGLISGLLALMDGLREILRLIEATGEEGQRSTDADHELIEHLEGLKSGSIDSPWIVEPILAEGRSLGAEIGLEALVAPQPVSTVPAATTRDKTLRIDVEVLNRMMNLVGELVLTRNQILKCSPDASNFAELALRLDSVTADLRESVMRARMQPVGHLFNKFPRMVRDLARSCGRQVRIEFEGQETGLDKSLLEAIRDPLAHAVRNSVDHGIELAEERLRAGKPAEGLIRLRAFHHGGSVVIEVTDDGAGISCERVLAKAIGLGMVTREQAAAMPERDAMQLVFEPGFSTAKEVTSVSGRGVGMDVVRSNVQRAGGSVELESRVGFGTTVRLRVPLTLAIVPALVVQSAGQSFALPQSSLIELVYQTRSAMDSSVERVGTVSLFRLRECLLPLVWLDQLLGLERGEQMETPALYIAVVESEGFRYGLVVDELMPPEEIVVKPLSAVLREIGVFSGATVLGNGTLAMILDVAAVGTRAGVRVLVEPSRRLAPVAEVVANKQAAVELPLVVFELSAGERMAMPLSVVERIEVVAIEMVEFVGGRALLQYRGEILRLEDEGGVLRSLEACGGLVTVLICLRPGVGGGRRSGIVVQRVLDVSVGTMLAQNSAVFGGDLVMVRDRVTPIHRESFSEVDDRMMEVA